MIEWLHPVTSLLTTTSSCPARRFVPGTVKPTSGSVIIAVPSNRVWSNLLAAIMSGQLPIAFLAEFWLLAKNAELATFSVQHFTTWLRLMSNADFKPILLINLSMIILSYSVISILRCRTDGQTFDYLHQ